MLPDGQGLPELLSLLSLRERAQRKPSVLAHCAGTDGLLCEALRRAAGPEGAGSALSRASWKRPGHTSLGFPAGSAQRVTRTDGGRVCGSAS